jgi:hypothetical protein
VTKQEAKDVTRPQESAERPFPVGTGQSDEVLNSGPLTCSAGIRVMVDKKACQAEAPRVTDRIERVTFQFKGNKYAG